MPRKKKEPPKKIYKQKIISYIMSPEVLECIEKLQVEEGIKTMSKAITKCIMNYTAMNGKNKRLTEELYSAINEARNNKAKSANFVHALKALMEDPTENSEVDQDTYDEDFDPDDE